ncbi:MAG TPA: hypothetical protein VJK30_04525 [Coxiellaceae bacterium]|nr:hypothetical protein [Coxiellaceae bacterium]
MITIENKKDMDAITERQEYTLQNVDMATILQSIPANYNGVLAERNLSPDATIYLLHYTEDLTLNCRIVTPIITATFLAIYCPVHPNIICELQKENEQYHLRLRKQKDLSFSAGGALSKKSSSESEFVATIDPDIVNLVNKAIEELLPIVNKFFARVIKGGKKLAVFTRIKLGEPLAQPTQTLTKLIDSTVADKITAEDVMKRERAARQKKLMQDKKEQQKGIEAEKSSLNGHHKNIDEFLNKCKTYLAQLTKCEAALQERIALHEKKSDEIIFTRKINGQLINLKRDITDLRSDKEKIIERLNALNLLIAENIAKKENFLKNITTAMSEIEAKTKIFDEHIAELKEATPTLTPSPAQDTNFNRYRTYCIPNRDKSVLGASQFTLFSTKHFSTNGEPHYQMTGQNIFRVYYK